MKTFAFELSMPGVSSWNGRWSGEKDLYVVFKRLSKQRIEESQIKVGNYGYDFGDGWRARVNVRQVDSKERQKLSRKSKGFAGYDWMVESIIKHGKIIAED
jgi:hypothetical protein